MTHLINLMQRSFDEEEDNHLFSCGHLVHSICFFFIHKLCNNFIYIFELVFKYKCKNY